MSGSASGLRSILDRDHALGAHGVRSKADAGEIWRRFPKFVLGFWSPPPSSHCLSEAMICGVQKRSAAGLVAPLQALRTWRSLRLSEHRTDDEIPRVCVGRRTAFYAFTIGVAVNVVLGYVLSTRCSTDFGPGSANEDGARQFVRWVRYFNGRRRTSKRRCPDWPA